MLPLSYLRPDVGWTTRFEAVKDAEVVGRLVQEGGRLLAFKREAKTFEAWLPHEICYIRFPAEIQPPQPQGASAETKTFGPDEFEAIWMHADYPDLFNETLRCDGWRSESMAHVLLTRFRKDPGGFLAALARAYPEEVERVADFLVYGASYGALDKFSYVYHPWYEKIHVGDGVAEVVVQPRASGNEALTLNSVSMGDEVHRLTLVRRADLYRCPGSGGTKVVEEVLERGGLVLVQGLPFRRRCVQYESKVRRLVELITEVPKMKIGRLITLAVVLLASGIVFVGRANTERELQEFKLVSI